MPTRSNEDRMQSKINNKKINTQKSVAFLYTNSKRSERESKETITFTITSKRIKYLGVNLPKTCTPKTIRHCTPKTIRPVLQKL